MAFLIQSGKLREPFMRELFVESSVLSDPRLDQIVLNWILVSMLTAAVSRSIENDNVQTDTLSVWFFSTCDRAGFLDTMNEQLQEGYTSVRP